MLGRIGAWTEMLKLSTNVIGLKKEVRNFYRGNALNVFRKEGWFDFMVQPRNIEKIAGHFGYTDLDYLRHILDLLANDGILSHDNGTYRTNGLVEEMPIVLPRFFGHAMADICRDAAASFPDRLKGQTATFSDGLNLFNWDDTLGLKLYERLRFAAFRFARALDRRGAFLDVGCGNGFGTVAIWGYYQKLGAFRPDSSMQIFGLEPDEGLRTIAADEFPQFASRLLNLEKDTISQLSEYHPKYVGGYAENIPFDDEYFDIVYTSQVLHWCNGELATKEMMRVLKPGGLLFGTESFYPSMDPYVELFTLLNEGAGGVIKKEDFTRWATESGAIDVQYATPMTVFKVVKG